MSTSMREVLEQIAAVCADNAPGHCDKALALKFVADVASAALSSPALSEASAIKRDLEGAKVGLDALLAAVHAGDPKRELLVRIGDLMRDVKVASERADRLSRQPEAEPVAWRYKFNGKWHLCDNESFAKQGLEAHPLYTSPRLDRERLARTLYRRLVLNPPADFDDASADLQNEWLQLADAIMRETR